MLNLIAGGIQPSLLKEIQDALKVSKVDIFVEKIID